MKTTNNNQLQKLYNGNQTIINAPYTMQSNYIVPVLARMVNEKLLPQKSMDVIQAILTFKHTEANPFPTYETVATFLGKSHSYVKKAVEAIKNIGILGVKKHVDKSGKEQKNNVYDFSPFFALLENFIIEFVHKGNSKVKIADLLKVKVVKKEEADKDFSWSEQYKDEEKAVVPSVPAETVQDASDEVEEVPEVTLPSTIEDVLTAYSVKPEGIAAVKKAYKAFSSKLAPEIFVEKIVASLDKKDFVNYFTKCITTAYTTNEQPKQASPAPTHKTPYSSKFKKVGVVPDWFETVEERKAAEQRKTEEDRLNEEFTKALNKVGTVKELDELVFDKELNGSQLLAYNERRNTLIVFENERKDILAKLNLGNSDSQEGAK